MLEVAHRKNFSSRLTVERNGEESFLNKVTSKMTRKRETSGPNKGWSSGCQWQRRVKSIPSNGNNSMRPGREREP